jgi:hypothetical protein
LALGEGDSAESDPLCLAHLIESSRMTFPRGG